MGRIEDLKRKLSILSGDGHNRLSSHTTRKNKPRPKWYSDAQAEKKREDWARWRRSQGIAKSEGRLRRYARERAQKEQKPPGWTSTSIYVGTGKVRTGYRVKQDMQYKANQRARQEKLTQFRKEHPRAECMSCHKKTRWQAKHPWRTQCKDCDPVRTVD